MSEGFACSRCGGTKDDGEQCLRCATDSMHDLRSRRARQLFEDGETRFRTARIQRMTAYGAAIAVLDRILPARRYPFLAALPPPDRD